jgi:cytidylate kinase
MLVYPLLISGKQGSGKSKTSDALEKLLNKDGFNAYRTKFARPLYEMHDLLLSYLTRIGIKVPQKDGKLLQLLGTDWGRVVYGEDVWVRCTKHDFAAMKEAYAKGGASFKGGVFLVDDLRFQNELAAFQEDGFTVRLECDKWVRKARAESWRDDDTHQSEIDLDNSLSSFDMVIDTTTDSSPESTAHEILEKFLMYVAHINS